MFFVPQSGRLQCQNGAYLSELDEELTQLLFGDLNLPNGQVGSPAQDVRTSQQLREVEARVGQQVFSNRVKDNYNGRCSFPGCSVTDRRFLVGAHVARWADVPELRGNLGNGIALCAMHDQAFEQGLFALSADHRVHLNLTRLHARPWAHEFLAPASGQQILLGSVHPTINALEHHGARIRFRP
jgi:predicted restriction endonuclease